MTGCAVGGREGRGCQHPHPTIFLKPLSPIKTDAHPHPPMGHPPLKNEAPPFEKQPPIET